MSSHTFKVGDRVRIVGGDYCIGREAIVVRRHGDTAYYDVQVSGENEIAGRLRVSLCQITPIPFTTPSPIKTVKQIVPGEYGCVRVRSAAVDGAVYVILGDLSDDCATRVMAPDLRSAAKVFTELANALDEQGSGQ